MESTPRYLEDLTVGDKCTTRSIEVTAAESLEFATRFDPQPMHLDVAGIASGWHTAALVMRLTVDAQPFGGAPVLGLGVDEVRWPTPVRPGDTIQAEIEILSITPSKSKPDYGVVRIKTTARNQRGEVVLTLMPILWVQRRPTY